MTLIKKSSFVPGVNTWFDSLFGDDFFNGFRPAQWTKGHSALPAVNVKETEKAFELEIAAPGMQKEDFQIDLHDHLLTISAEKKQENEQKTDGKYMRREFSYTSFKRTFALPEDTADLQAIEAKYQDGILRLNVPKKVAEKTETKRVISIQ